MKKSFKYLICAVLFVASAFVTDSAAKAECPEGTQLYGFLTTCETGAPHVECLDKLISNDDLLSIAIEYEALCD